MIIVIKQDNGIFIICNIYGHNSHSFNKTLFAQTSPNFKMLYDKYNDSHILGGDFKECMDISLGRYPPRTSQGTPANNLILSLCSDLSLIDTWCFFLP